MNRRQRIVLDLADAWWAVKYTVVESGYWVLYRILRLFDWFDDWDRRELATGLMLAAVVGIVLAVSSCTRGEYWEDTAKPGLVLGVLYMPQAQVTAACQGRPAVGCYDGNFIYIASELTDLQKQCVKNHEYAHAAGRRHPKFDADTSTLGMDCGDGTIMPG